MENKNEKRICQNCKKDFSIEIEDFNFYEKIKVPPPTFCPLCRVERRSVYRNERKLFKARDAFSNKEMQEFAEIGRKYVKFCEVRG